MRAQDYEQAHGIASPAATSTGASATVTSSGAAVGTIATADAVLSNLPPELVETPPVPEEDAYHPPPALEAAPMPAAEDAYPPPSQVNYPFPSNLLEKESLTHLCILRGLQYPPLQESYHAVTPPRQDRSYGQESPHQARSSHFVGPDGSFLREMEEEGAFIDSTVP